MKRKYLSSSKMVILLAVASLMLVVIVSFVIYMTSYKVTPETANDSFLRITSLAASNNSDLVSKGKVIDDGCTPEKGKHGGIYGPQRLYCSYDAVATFKVKDGPVYDEVEALNRKLVSNGWKTSATAAGQVFDGTFSSRTREKGLGVNISYSKDGGKESLTVDSDRDQILSSFQLTYSIIYAFK